MKRTVEVNVIVWFIVCMMAGSGLAFWIGKIAP